MFEDKQKKKKIEKTKMSFYQPAPDFKAKILSSDCENFDLVEKIASNHMSNTKSMFISITFRYSMCLI